MSLLSWVSLWGEPCIYSLSGPDACLLSLFSDVFGQCIFNHRHLLKYSVPSLKDHLPLRLNLVVFLLPVSRVPPLLWNEVITLLETLTAPQPLTGRDTLVSLLPVVQLNH